MNKPRKADLQLQRLRRSRWMYDASLPVLILLVVAGALWASRNPQHAPLIALGIPVGAAILSHVTQKSVALRSRISQGEDLAISGALELLEDAFTRVNQSVEKGRRSRIDWLTAARNIAISRQLLSQVQEPAKRALALEKELLFRLRFRNILNPLETGDLNGLPQDFFTDSPADYTGFVCSRGKLDPISESSLVEIYRFTRWPEDVEDVLDEKLRFSASEIDKMVTFGPRNLGRLMAEVHKISGLRLRREPCQQPEDFLDEY